MTVHWTDDLRQKIIPWRGHGTAAADSSMPAKTLLAEIALCGSEVPGTGSAANSITHRWGNLRRALVVARQPDYDAALSAARALWPKADVLPRCALAYAFPNEADWASSTAQTFIALIKKQKGKIAPYEAGLGLLAAVADPELQTSIARAAAAKRVALYALTDQIATMVELTGAASATGLAALLEKAPSNDHKTDYASFLAMIETDEAARALASAIASKVVLAVAKPYFERYPKLAKPALAAVAKGSSTSAPIAALLLRSV